MAHSLTHLEQLDTIPESSDSSFKLNLLRKQTLPSYNCSDSTRTAETCAKSYNNLMKPLQVSQKRRIVLSLKKASSKAEGLFQNLKYDDFMLRISELKEISKLHEESVFAKDKRKKTEKCEDDDYLKNNLSERAYRYVELARESKKSIEQLSYDNTAIQFPTINFDPRDNSTERGVKLEDMEEQQVHLSNLKERTIGKQLNNNAHFRYVSRKILTPRAQVDTFSLRNVSLSSEESPFRIKTSRTQTRHPQVVNENSHYTPLIPSMVVVEDYIDAPSIADSPPRFGAWINLTEAGNKTHNGLSSLRSPIIDREPRTVKNGNLDSFNKILEFGGTPVKPKLSSVNDFRLTRSTTFDTFSSISKGSNSPLKRKITLTSQGLEASSRLDKSVSRSGKLLKKQASSSSFKEQKSNIFQTEIETILEDDDVKPETEFIRPVSTVNKIIKSTKSYNALKHFRASSQTFVSQKSLEPEKEVKSLRKMKIRTPRREFDNGDSPVCKTVQELIEKSYQGDVSEREIRVKNMQELLNSYGFEDTIGDIKTARPKGRFNSLEGYQGQFNKATIAKTERFVDKILQRNNKNNYTVK